MDEDSELLQMEEGSKKSTLCDENPSRKRKNLEDPSTQCMQSQKSQPVAYSEPNFDKSTICDGDSSKKLTRNSEDPLVQLMQSPILQPVVGPKLNAENSIFYNGNSSREIKLNPKDPMVQLMQSPIFYPVAVPEPKTYKSNFYDGNSWWQIKRNSEASLMQFRQSSIPQPVDAPGLDSDRSFFDSLIIFLKDFTMDQKLEFRCEVLALINRMRKFYSLNNAYNHTNLPSTARQASASNKVCANLIHPQFLHSCPPHSTTHLRFPHSFQPSSNFSPNFIPMVRSSQIRTHLQSSPSISSPYLIPGVCSPRLTANSFSPMNLPCNQTITRGSTSVYFTDKESFSDSENSDSSKDI